MTYSLTSDVEGALDGVGSEVDMAGSMGWNSNFHRGSFRGLGVL
jgi:hypothetical protein